MAGHTPWIFPRRSFSWHATRTTRHMVVTVAQSEERVTPSFVVLQKRSHCAEAHSDGDKDVTSEDTTSCGDSQASDDYGDTMTVVRSYGDNTADVSA
eukprot:5163611-Amphidinium_carterae.1